MICAFAESSRSYPCHPLLFPLILSFRSFAHGIQLAFARTRDLAGCSNARLVSFEQKSPKSFQQKKAAYGVGQGSCPAHRLLGIYRQGLFHAFLVLIKLRGYFI